jgi:predicted GNAT family acetyltransferase
MSNLTIAHNLPAQRFEVQVDGWSARCDYRMVDGVMHMVHTEVPHAIEGRGIAAALVKTAFEWAATQGVKIKPRCSYVRAYAERHPETRDLIVV